MIKQPTTTCIKKLMHFIHSVETNPNQYYIAKPTADNLLIWHVLIRNLDDDYQGGHYIMKITFPPNYPFEPPSFQFLTPNGKFEIDKNICLSNSNFHADTWSPLWGIDQIIMGNISMFYEKNTTGVGHLKYNQEINIKYASESIKYNQQTHTDIYNSFFLTS